MATSFAKPASYTPDVTDAFCNHFIRKTAKALIGNETFRPSDRDDVIQELRLALIEQLDHFDPERARWSTFVKMVIRSAAVTLRRRATAECRQTPPDMASLNTVVRDGDGQPVELGSTVSEQEYATGAGCQYLSHTLRIEFSLDVQALITGLPGELREICHRLKSQSFLEVQESMGFAATTLQRRIDKLREHFLAAGLSDIS